VRKRIEASRRRIRNAHIREKQRIAALVEKEKSAQRQALADAAHGTHEADAGVLANRATNGRNSNKTERAVRVEPQTATANRSEDRVVLQAEPNHSATIFAFAETVSAELIRVPLENQTNTQRHATEPAPAHFSYARALSEQLQPAASIDNTDTDTDTDTDRIDTDSENAFAGMPQTTDPETHYDIDYKQVPPEVTSRKRLIAGAATATLALASVGGLLAYDRVAGLTQVFAASPQDPVIAEQPVGHTKYGEFSMRISDRIATSPAVAETQHTVAHLR
jgi:hypothetical protein